MTATATSVPHLHFEHFAHMAPVSQWPIVETVMHYFRHWLRPDLLPRNIQSTAQPGGTTAPPVETGSQPDPQTCLVAIAPSVLEARRWESKRHMYVLCIRDLCRLLTCNDSQRESR